MFNIHSDIKKSATLPTNFYNDPHIFDKSKETIFARTWQYVADSSVVAEKGQQYPFILLDKVLNEPLLFTKNYDNKLHCMSNVCTHRGKVIVEKPSKTRFLSCGYHGRCFALDGQFKSMPAFKEVENFPTPADNLAKVSFSEWANMLFCSLDPMASFEDFMKPMQERLSFLPLDSLVFESEHGEEFDVKAHWALYCDNYLEGFHIPFVHPALNEALVFDEYDYEIFPYANLQLGIGKEGEPCFDIPEGVKDYGKLVYAYYFWVFPNLMFNFYPWGLSLNVIEPVSHERTKVRFLTFRFADKELTRTHNNLHQTEMEDEAVVESVQLGVQSRFYKQGRFSPSMEKGVHHFHRLIAETLV